MKRYLAHHIIIDGKHYDSLSIVTINENNTVSVEPYTHEIHSTVYVGGTLVIATSAEDVKISVINQ